MPEPASARKGDQTEEDMDSMNPCERTHPQFLAGLQMLEQTVRECPGALWTSDRFHNKTWHVCYHALYYTHLYLCDSLQGFVPWGKHRLNHQFLGPPWPPDREPEITGPYEKEEILEYLELCRSELAERLPLLDPDAPSGFPWLPFDKLETLMYSARHLQHHVGQLAERLRTEDGIGIRWVATIPDPWR